MPDTLTPHRTPVEQAMTAVTAEAERDAGRRGPALAARYAALAPLLEAEARWDEAAIAWQAAAMGVPPGAAAPALAAAQRALALADRENGILGEHAAWLAERRRAERYPTHVSIETLARCNAACLFCPYPRIARQGARMPDAMLDRILRELGDIPHTHRFGLSFHHMSEPFLDRRFPDLLRRAERELPQAQVTVVTNGSALNAANIALLCGLRNLAAVNISFNDHRAEAYEAAMRLPQARTLGNIDALHAAAEAGRYRVRTVLRRVGDGTAADRDFLAFCRGRWPRFAAVTRRAKDFLGQIEQGPSGIPIGRLAHGETPVMGCAQWTQMTVTADGKVVVCCFDGMAEWPLADLAGRHLLEAWNAPELRRFRERCYTRLEAPAPCAGCSIFWTGRRMNTV